MRFLAQAAVAEPPDPRPTLTLDLAIPALDVDYRLFAELGRLAPCGTGNRSVGFCGSNGRERKRSISSRSIIRNASCAGARLTPRRCRSR